MMRFRLFAAAVVCTGLMAGSTLGQRQMEQIGRSVIAMRTSEGSAYVGWRMLGTDPEAVAFNLYRSTDDGRPDPVEQQPDLKFDELR